MSVFSVMRKFASEYRAARSRHLTERQIQALPFDIQKDIGWPGSSGRNVSRPVHVLWPGAL